MQKSKVLIVDDMEINQVVLSCILEELEIETHTANSGAEALALLDDNEYAMILMDIQMPNMSGFECVSLIRKNPQTHHIPVMFVTAMGNDAKFIDEGYHLGAVDYLTKPVDPDIMLSKARVFIALHEQRIQLQNSLAEANNIKEKYNELLNFMAEGILGVDEGNIITFANMAACTLLTSKREEVVGRSIKEFISPDVSQKMWDESDFNNIFKDGQCNHNDDAVFWRHGSDQFPVEYSQASILKDNKPVGGVIAFQDISERKMASYKKHNLAVNAEHA